jgi:hypothetical protein
MAAMHRWKAVRSRVRRICWVLAVFQGPSASKNCNCTTCAVDATDLTATEANIVTSNLPFESWTEVLGSERLTGATLDRLTQRCNITEAKDESYRLRNAKARSRRAKPSVDSSGSQPADQALITM